MKRGQQMGGTASFRKEAVFHQKPAVIISILVIHISYYTLPLCICMDVPTLAGLGLFCPWAQRVNLVRHLKGLTDIIPVSIVKPYPKGDENGWPGWCFPKSDDEYPGSTVDKLFGSSYLHQVYFRADEEYKGRYSVPLLWDTVTSTIVCNESSEMLRWLPQAFDSILPPDSPNRSLKLYPRELAAQIDDLSVWLQTDLNSAVYRTGFSKIQADYEVAVRVVFHALNDLEALIYRNGGPFILGRGMTELDIRAYVTIVRFDTVYVQHFKCNLGTIRHDYPVINAWLSNIYFGISGFQQCTNFKHIKENCMSTLIQTGIIRKSISRGHMI